MKQLLFVYLAIPLLLVPHAYAEDPIPTEVSRTVHDVFGSAFEIADGHFLIADFNGDGKPDLAVDLRGEAFRLTIPKPGFNTFFVDPSYQHNWDGKLKIGGEHCLGLGIVLNFKRLPNEIPKKDRFYTYECYSGGTIVPKSQKISPPPPEMQWKESPPTLRGDGFLMDLESGAKVLIYWTGETFRAYPQEMGD